MYLFLICSNDVQISLQRQDVKLTQTITLDVSNVSNVVAILHLQSLIDSSNVVAISNLQSLIDSAYLYVLLINEKSVKIYCRQYLTMMLDTSSKRNKNKIIVSVCVGCKINLLSLKISISFIITLN